MPSVVAVCFFGGRVCHPDFDRCSWRHLYVLFFVMWTYSEGVVFTRFKSAESQSDQLCYSHIYLFDDCDGSTPCQVDFLWGFFFAQREGFCESVVMGKGYSSLPHKLFTMSWCHVASLGEREGLKKKKSIFLVIALVLWIQFFQLAFVSLCRRKRF